MKAHPIAQLFPLLEGAEFDALVASMRANGYDARHPIIVLDGMILDGRNRFRAASEAGVTPNTIEWTEADGNPWDFVWRENAVRRHLEIGRLKCIELQFREGAAKERARLVQESANKARSEAATAQHAVSNPRAGETFGGGPHGPRPNAEANRATDRTERKAMQLKHESPPQFARVVAGEVSLDKALGEVKLAAKRALAEEIRANPVVTPDGRYQVIVSDPPWKYDSRAEDTSHRGKNQYPDMTTDEICALPVMSLAQEDCILWLWTTNAFMADAYLCLDAWGFEAKTILTWDKQKLGLGDWLRNVTEHCILAVRGRPVVALTNQTTLISEARREHSRKPESFYALVEELCPGSKLEMFSRTPRSGWAAWGAETERFGS